ncbi:hypothetical protein V1T75_06180 [Tenacibaculum sp. FZY0031]|uniref:hypothetical protein n=1 Tax=unclassified Tenacibaculum TaxID=2635139 RepID=UPI002EBD8511|nr:hypothetical protein [Tenacibaculum sp. FZY0031]
MKKTILNLGTVLGKTAQKEILGGFKTQACYTDSDCCNFQHNSSYGYVCELQGGDTGICVPGIFGENPCGL